MTRITIAELLERARSTLERLVPEQALQAHRAGALLVDLRCHDERARHGTIPGSLHVPRTVLEWRLDPDSPYRNSHLTDLTRHVILVCSDGYSSSLAAATLQELGYKRATDVIGGFNAWKSRGLPISRARAIGDGLAGMGTPAPI